MSLFWTFKSSLRIKGRRRFEKEERGGGEGGELGEGKGEKEGGRKREGGE